MHYSMRFFCVLAVLVTPLSMAVDRVDVTLGGLLRPTGSNSQPSAVGIAAGWDLPWRWLDSNTGALVSRVDLEAGYVNTPKDAVWSVIASPVLRYQWQAQRWCAPFVEASVGVAWLSSRHWGATHDMGSQLLFADRVGAGCRFGHNELSLDLRHYSNADLAKPNDGAELLLLRYGRLF